MLAQPAPRRIHYAWIIAIVTFFVLIVTAGVRSTPSVLMIPLEREFGWSRPVVSLAVSINIFLYGLCGPFAAAMCSHPDLGWMAGDHRAQHIRVGQPNRIQRR